MGLLPFLGFLHYPLSIIHYQLLYGQLSIKKGLPNPNGTTLRYVAPPLKNHPQSVRAEKIRKLMGEVGIKPIRASDFAVGLDLNPDVTRLQESHARVNQIIKLERILHTRLIEAIWLIKNQRSRACL